MKRTHTFMKKKLEKLCLCNYKSLLILHSNTILMMQNSKIYFPNRMLHLERPWFSFLVFFLSFFFFGNIAHSCRSPGWMICVGTFIIFMGLQNVSVLPGSYACLTFATQSHTAEVQH